jgi:hypothetical protein
MGIQVSFITYGNRKDLQYQPHLKGIQVFCNTWHLPPSFYESLFSFFKPRGSARASLIKSNQINGADVALRAARFWNKPFIARVGIYTQSTLKNSTARIRHCLSKPFG